MSELGIATAASDKIVLAVISHLNEGNIEDAVALFADQFSFKDHGIRLEFNTKDRLAEFYWKARELYPDAVLQTERIFVSGSNALIEWTLHRTGFWQLQVESSNLAAWGFRGSYRTRQDHKLVRLL